MKIKIIEGTKEEVEAGDATLKSMDGVVVKFGQYHPVVVNGEVRHCLMVWYEGELK